jgi:hypothetical protein
VDQTALVGPDVSAGRRLVDALGSNLQVEAAFWWMEEDTWSLVLATPLVHEQGPLSGYSRIRDVIESTAALSRDLFDRVNVVSTRSGMIAAFDGEGQIPLSRLILHESIKNVYVAGVYFYKFQPETFAKAS